MAKINSIGNETESLKINEVYNLPSADGVANSVMISDALGDITWQTQEASAKIIFEEVTIATKTLEVNHAYGANRAGGIEFTLPTTSAVGDVIQIIGISGIWKIKQNEMQTIYFGTENAIGGFAGILSSENLGDCITLKCIEANKTWRGTSYYGSFETQETPATYISFARGKTASYGLKSNGLLKSFGMNGWGELGDGTRNTRSSPVAVIGGHSFTNIFSRHSFAIAMKADGTCWSWGYNNYGQLGDGTTTNRSSPVTVVGGHSFVDIVISSISSVGFVFVMARKADGSIWGWGYNANYQLGDGTTTNRSSPVAVLGSHSFVDVAVGEYFCMARKADGTLWGWGSNGYGQLGTDTTANHYSPVAVVGGHSFVDVALGSSHCIARKADGTLWGWGYNSNGRLGDGTTANRSSPVAVIGGYLFDFVKCDLFCNIARQTDGTLWGWGSNGYGQLGDGTTTSRSSPVAVVGGHSFVDVVINASYCIAMKADGTLWSWGGNGWGELGDGTRNTRSSPVAVVGGHSFVKVMANATASYGANIAMKADGTLWGWGYNNGQLGDGTTTSRSSPVAVLP